MKTKNILLGIFSLLTFAAFAQTENNNTTEPKISVTELKVETANLDELKNFNWDIVKKMFQENDENQEITLAFSFVNKSEVTDNSKVSIDDFEFKISGKSADIENIIKSTKSSVDKFIKLKEK
ncbi:MAG: hypothetical protein ACOH1N_10525 [Lutibacter sp.]